MLVLLLLFALSILCIIVALVAIITQVIRKQYCKIKCWLIVLAIPVVLLSSLYYYLYARDLTSQQVSNIEPIKTLKVPSNLQSV